MVLGEKEKGEGRAYLQANRRGAEMLHRQAAVDLHQQVCHPVLHGTCKQQKKKKMHMSNNERRKFQN
jgi:hypothetical protein